ncbi:hypothetical protein SARC_05633 [Sphaeroforma arctica JP610]|uniref:Uncharacterized protein n=1 Tax=Sphaeroforma arctica JP610 TaxID=667725 RepID=A0A0L0FZ34_9EUKA|nr:hypothetical protein SARC_05633 [Sphaeroforma arctica JP610]KNC82082.1 hypothetical protein SARC_05633 [Sphaeroforma arctica JP610]|eukprot:XP_014155984.1 hypothetical protein SARC_05633 [Sphaeroforma arctica JP610]
MPAFQSPIQKSMTEDDFKTAIAAVRALSSKLPPKVVRKPLKKGQTTDKTQKQRGSKPTSHQTAVASQSASPTRAIKAKSYWNNLLTYATLFENSSKAHGMVVAHIRRSMEMALEMADAPDTPIVVTEGTMVVLTLTRIGRDVQVLML